MLLVVIMSRNKITLQIILLLSMRKLNLWTGYMPRGYIQLHGLICRQIQLINSKNMKKHVTSQIKLANYNSHIIHIQLSLLNAMLNSNFSMCCTAE